MSNSNYAVTTGHSTKLEKLWVSLGNEVIDKNECLEREWHIFPKGTHREHIWHWFEDQDKNFSVAKHLYGEHI